MIVGICLSFQVFEVEVQSLGQWLEEISRIQLSRVWETWLEQIWL
jgi:hypothetical protein